MGLTLPKVQNHSKRFKLMMINTALRILVIDHTQPASRQLAKLAPRSCPKESIWIWQAQACHCSRLGHLGTWNIRISWDIPTYLTYPDLSATYG